MTTLFDYMKDVQRWLAEKRQENINPDDLISFINRARREVAMRTQCIRVLTPISGSIVSCTVTNAGSGYSAAPTVTISDPDFPSGLVDNPNGLQATASAIVEQGTIAGIDITLAGAGYFAPSVAITDTTGSGASATLTISPINILNAGQEFYRASDVDLSMFPGVDSIYFVRGVSLIYSNYRYSIPCYAFSTYQASIRNFPAGSYQWVPSFFSQFGQGADASFYFFPLPSQSFQVEWDCNVLPIDLDDDQSVEAIPKPWTDAVAYLAAHYCFASVQNFNAAQFYLQLYEKFVQSYSNYARAGRVTNPYGRYVLPFILGGITTLQHLAEGFLSWL